MKLKILSIKLVDCPKLQSKVSVPQCYRCEFLILDDFDIKGFIECIYKGA